MAWRVLSVSMSRPPRCTQTMATPPAIPRIDQNMRRAGVRLERRRTPLGEGNAEYLRDREKSPYPPSDFMMMAVSGNRGEGAEERGGKGRGGGPGRTQSQEIADEWVGNDAPEGGREPGKRTAKQAGYADNKIPEVR